MYDFLLVRHCNYSSVFRCLVPFASYLTLNNTAILKCGSKSLKVIEAGAIQKLGYGFLFAFHSIWRYLVSFARYSDLLVENREIIIPHLYLAPPQGVTPSEFCESV